MSIKAFPSGILVGFGLAYFLDPLRGRKRRARVGELAQHLRRREGDLVGKATRDAQHRVHGLAERVRHVPSAEAPDEVIEARVRSHLGRYVTHAHGLEVIANNRRVTLRGPIADDEAELALRIVRRVPGVDDVIDQLARGPREPGEQRLLHRRGGALRAPAYQVGAAVAGLGLAAWGLLFRRGLTGLIAAAGGSALAARGLLDRPLVGKDAIIDIDKTVTVHAPVERVFDLWRDFAAFPKFMHHVHEVEVEGDRSAWRVDGPAGTVIAFDAQTTEVVPNQLIAWRTLPDQSIEHDGVVRFESVDGGTRVHVRMRYCPPGGMLAHAVAHLLGWDPKSRMDRDLIRMKALVEQGKTRAHGRRISIDQLH